MEVGELQAARVEMRKPCLRCGNSEGYVVTKTGQDVVRCGRCDTYAYCQPKDESGRAARSVSKNIHSKIKPKQRARIILRDRCCVLCGSHDDLHVGHLLSVQAGVEAGMTEEQLNDDENLAAMCAECNLGIGSLPLPLTIVVNLLKSRTSPPNAERIGFVEEP